MTVASLALPDTDDRLRRGDWVRAEPFRAHLRHLIAATGLPWRALARLAGATPQEVQTLLSGGRDGRHVRRIRLDLARRLYALTPDSVAATRRSVVRVELAAAGLGQLLANGWTLSELSSRLQLSAELLRGLAEGRRPVCSRLVEAKILAAVQALGSVRPDTVATGWTPARDAAELVLEDAA